MNYQDPLASNTCARDSDCCQGKCDVDVCCAAAGQGCGSDSECCSDDCDGGVCALTTPEYVLGPQTASYCGASSDCPVGYWCRNRLCLGQRSAVCCGPEAVNDCAPWFGCLGATCDADSGLCGCSGNTGGCESDQDCCDAGHCVLGYCGP